MTEKKHATNPMAWMNLTKKKESISIVEKADPDEVIAAIKVHWKRWFDTLLPGLFESQAFRNAIAAMPKEPPSWDRGNACDEAQVLAGVLLKIKQRQEFHRILGHNLGEYDINMAEQQAYWSEQRNELHNHLCKALEIFEAGQLTDEERAAYDDPEEKCRPKHHMDVKALKEWVKTTRMIHPVALFTKCPNPIMQHGYHEPFSIKSAKGGHSLESRTITAFIRSVLYRVPEDTPNRFAIVRDLLVLADTHVDRSQVKDAARGHKT